MSDNEANPYAPPATVDDPVSHRAPTSAMIPVYVAIAALCYIGFTVFLFMSGSSIDRKGGMMFMFNVPVLLFWFLAVVRIRQFALVAGGIAVVVQGVILLAMLVEIGGMIVVVINGGIIAVLLILVWLSQRSTRK
jgi:hypothetical protein